MRPTVVKRPHTGGPSNCTSVYLYIFVIRFDSRTTMQMFKLFKLILLQAICIIKVLVYLNMIPAITVVISPHVIHVFT